MNFSTLEKVDKNFAMEDFKTRESDLFGKITFKKSPIYVDLLLEFQSTVDKSMPMRSKIREYEQKLIEQGIEKDKIETAGRLLAMGFSIPDICKATDLPESVVVRLKE